jgi:carbamoyl-phosphate synthase small subunit
MTDVKIPVIPVGAQSCRVGFSRPADAALVLASGEILWGRGAGASGLAVGEVCFNTSMTGYQEISTDPSYAGQIITFTFPHVGNVGTNIEDIETATPYARGCVLRAEITQPASWRASGLMGGNLDAWLKSMEIIAISGVDTRRLTRIIRDSGAPTGVIVRGKNGNPPDIKAAFIKAKEWPGLEGMDLAKEVSCSKSYTWDESEWSFRQGFSQQKNPKFHVVAIDYGAKRNILRCLASAGCRVTVVSATAPIEEILGHKPDGIFLSNGPGDPAATGDYAVPIIKNLLKTDLPLFGICLGHQILSLALGCKTSKMHLGHRGANQPVKNLETGKVEITSQNHGFVVERESLPNEVVETHISLFDNALEGIKLDGRPVFSVQFHPEASPGPHDSHYLFKQFVELMGASCK